MIVIEAISGVCCHNVIRANSSSKRSAYGLGSVRPGQWDFLLHSRIVTTKSRQTGLNFLSNINVLITKVAG